MYGAVDDFIALVRRPAWMADAACAEHQDTPHWWFPEHGRNADQAAAVAVCSGCLVRNECGAYAFTFADTARHGVWGALTSTQRRRLADRVSPALLRALPLPAYDAYVGLGAGEAVAPAW